MPTPASKAPQRRFFPLSHGWLKLWLTLGGGAALCLVWLLRLPCPFFALTGLPCATCGMTRAWSAVFHGNLSDAFSFHPLFWAAPVLYAYGLADGHLLGRPRLDRVILGGLVTAFLLLGIGRWLIPSWSGNL